MVTDIVDRLDALGITAVIQGGRLTTKGSKGVIDQALTAAIRDERAMLFNVIAGRASGHVPGICTTCGEISMTAGWDTKREPRQAPPANQAGSALDKFWSPCRMTPGCDGRHQPRQSDLERTTPRARPKQATPPRTIDTRRLLGPDAPWPDSDHQPSKETNQ